MKKLSLLIVLIATLGLTSCKQEVLLPSTFPLGEVALLDGPFLDASNLNTEVLLQYDTDRLLAPFLKEAGLPAKAELFPNWAGLDGHVGGHYLSALAICYASNGNSECKERLDYMVSELKRCQDNLGTGYVGGVPDGDILWKEISEGNIGRLNNYWVPWYNVHKLYAGLRDAWIYAGSQEAKEVFIKLCDWGISVINGLDDATMEKMLDMEFGGMGEVYADAYDITGDLKYLDAAKRFSHHWLLDSMVAGVDNLDNKHANTQVPKAVGYEKIAEMSLKAGRMEDYELYKKAAHFFWETVYTERSVAFGGNSRSEHFPTADNCDSYLTDVQGPETCNTHNMLRLTEGLFRMSPSVAYGDYIEKAIFNHILSSQHPEHGGYVYFTPTRPAHYRVYSAPNSGMWCCVGTGMENHSKYPQFIYMHKADDLYVNLFMASELNWEEKGLVLTQETSFPDSENSTITIKESNGKSANILIRKPSWCKDFTVSCNGEEYNTVDAESGYISIERKWKKGDVININFPMEITLEALPNVPDYVAIMKGPIVLGAKTGTEDLLGLVADDGRWAHIAHGKRLDGDSMPELKGSDEEILATLKAMQPVEGKTLTYTVPGFLPEDMVLEPFFRIHDSRYTIYWHKSE